MHRSGFETIVTGIVTLLLLKNLRIQTFGFLSYTKMKSMMLIECMYVVISIEVMEENRLWITLWQKELDIQDQEEKL